MLLYKIKDLCKFVIAFFISKIIRLIPKYRDIWVITERRDECKDNGYYLFKYMREVHPEMKVYYAINKNSMQKKKIEKYGNIIAFNSFLHYIYALSASRLIGAFLPCGIPNSICFFKFDFLLKGKKIFLQHGVTKEKIPSLLYSNTKVDCFICASRIEFEFVSKELGYGDKAKFTGFCRFDGLNKFDTDRIILVMPTWRKWIPSVTWNGKAVIPNDFEYFRMYKKLLSNPKIRKLLNEYHYKMIFFLHHEMQPYVDYFGQSNESIIIATEKEYDVQYLLKKAKCLITDFSSVSFDFAYMKKPVIYFQFDEKKYYENHYQKGYFDYNIMGFGKKCYNVEEVVFQLKKEFDNYFELIPKYRKRIDYFFEYGDNKNCERVYQAIKDLM